MQDLRYAPSGRRSLLSDYARSLGELVARDRAERALRAAKTESDLAGRAKSEFLANMSHELRTPLNAIIGFAEVIQTLATEDDNADSHCEKTAEYASYIAGAGRRLLAILSDILDVSQMDMNKLVLQCEPHDVAEILEATVAIASDRIAAKNQSLHVRIAPNLPMIDVDARRLKQVLLNLLSNAHKFTEEGGHIHLIAQSRSGEGIAIAVADNGIGMTSEQIEIALRPFGQIHTGYARRYEGTGLGLSIVAALTKLLGGQLQLSSAPGTGTTAVIVFPPSASPRETTILGATGTAGAPLAIS